MAFFIPPYLRNASGYPGISPFPHSAIHSFPRSIVGHRCCWPVPFPASGTLYFSPPTSLFLFGRTRLDELNIPFFYGPFASQVIFPVLLYRDRVMQADQVLRSEGQGGPALFLIFCETTLLFVPPVSLDNVLEDRHRLKPRQFFPLSRFPAPQFFALSLFLFTLHGVDCYNAASDMPVLGSSLFFLDRTTFWPHRRLFFVGISRSFSCPFSPDM